MDPALFEGLFAEILAPLVNGTLGKLSDGAKAQWKKVEDKRAAEAYKAKLVKRYGTIQILGQPRPQKLGKVYTDVYLHEKPTHSYAMQVEKLEEMFREHGNRFGMGDEQGERLDGLDFAKEHDRLFILGKPGAGKTTFLKYLTMQAANGDIPLIPIFVSLNDFQHQNVDLLDYLAEQFDVCDFPEAGPFIEQLLRKGKGLILFDGLDEVSKEDSQRSTITRQLRQFITKYDRNRFAITCRIAASDYQFQNFAYVEMADFTNKQVEAFVRKWFAESKPKIDGFLKELKGSGNEGLKEMTTSPLLLTLLCIQYDGSMALPPSRSEVYEEALEVLLKTWDGHRDINRGDLIVEDEDRYKALTYKRKMQLMSRLAYATFKEGKLFVEQKLLEDKIVEYIGKIPRGPDPEMVDGSVVLKAMESQHGVLVERASRIYSFSHLTLQEYFTAKYIVDYGKSGAALSSLIGEKRIADPRWREVFLFVSELVPNGDELVVWMAETLQQMATVGAAKKLVSWAEKRSMERPFSERSFISRLSFLLHAIDPTPVNPLSTSYNIKFDSELTRFLTRIPLRHRPHISIKQVHAEFSETLFKFLVVDLDIAISIATALVSIGVHKMALSIPHDYASRAGYDILLALKIAIEESKKLKWVHMTNALKQIFQFQEEGRELEDIYTELVKIDVEIILEGWVLGPYDKVKDAKFVEAWFIGHNLLLDCLSQVRLEDLDQEEFEDEYLYRLPPHVRPKLGDES